MSKRPNVLLFMVDEQRYPTVYDGKHLREWMEQNLPAQRKMRERGVEFHRHYAQSTACAPSRTSLFTGQYPTLHGVSQTDGMGKTAFDPGMSWLDPNTVPTMGDWFRAAGYQTHYRGKWHISHADILVPGTKQSLMTTEDDGTPKPENIEYYRAADRLNDFGFSGWIGPEPHGASEANSGWWRDPQYCREVHDLFDALERSDDDRPFLLVNSFVNPHDIVFYGLVWSRRFELSYPDLQQVPPIPPPPTEDEILLTKPKVQASYVERYRQMFLPQPVSDLYRRFYYFLQARVDRYILDVMHRLERSPYRDNTIIAFTSDHGDVLGAHGKMHQKWFNAYEEAIHVPLIFSGPLIADTPRDEHALTSHADLVPTLLGLCDIDVERAAKQLVQSHSETRPFVGRDLSPLVRGTGRVAPEPVFFMTFDNVSQGLSQVTGGRQWEAVVSPNQLETVIVELDGALWKYTMYAQNLPTPYEGQITNPEIMEKIEAYRCVEPEFEMYNLTEDPYERTNLAFPTHATAPVKVMQERLQRILDEQRQRKCLTPKVQQGEPRAGARAPPSTAADVAASRAATRAGGADAARSAGGTPALP